MSMRSCWRRATSGWKRTVTAGSPRTASARRARCTTNTSTSSAPRGTLLRPVRLWRAADSVRGGRRYQDMVVMADKARFAAHMRIMHQRFGDAFGFHPPTFRLPYQLEECRREHARVRAAAAFMCAARDLHAPCRMQVPHRHWLLKPSISCCGQNIRLVTGPDDPSLPRDLNNWVLQRFVHPPHIIWGAVARARRTDARR